MTIYQTEIHLTERTDSTPDERLFDGCIIGAANCFPTLSPMCAMTTKRALSWVTEVERVAWNWSEAKKFHADGSSSDSRIETHRFYHRFTNDEKPEIQGVTWVD